MNPNIKVFCLFIEMSQKQKVIETAEELEQCEDCGFFDFDEEVHLARVTKCYDGDTVHCVFKHDEVYQKFHVRMDGYDSWEMRANNKVAEPMRTELVQKALAAKERLEELVLGKNVYLYCGKFDKYGRILGVIRLKKSGETVNDLMIKEGHGYVYHGGTKHKSND